jgi:hypothetical protein
VIRTSIVCPLSAIGKLPITSAIPPTLTKGEHSEAAIKTFIKDDSTIEKSCRLESNALYTLMSVFKLGFKCMQFKNVFFLFLTLGFFISTNVFAQSDISSLGVAQYYDIADTIENGEIISLKSGKFVRSSVEYDPSMFGIVTENPALALTRRGDKTGVPIMVNGETFLKVNSLGGDIKAGDPITSSKNKGIGMKQVKEGFSIAIAKEDYSNPDKEKPGLISVFINKNYVYSDGTGQGVSEKPLLENFNISALRTYDSMSQVLKLSFAMVLIASSFGFGFLTFKRIAVRAVEATGRNPLAGRSIMLNLVITIIVTIVIIGAGLILSYLVLKL